MTELEDRIEVKARVELERRGRGRGGSCRERAEIGEGKHPLPPSLPS